MRKRFWRFSAETGTIARAGTRCRVLQLVPVGEEEKFREDVYAGRVSIYTCTRWYKYCAKRVEFDIVPPGKSGEQITSWSRWMVDRYLYNIHIYRSHLGAMRCDAKKIIIIRLYAYSLCIVCHRVRRRESHFTSNDRNVYIINIYLLYCTYTLYYKHTRQCKHNNKLLSMIVIIVVLTVRYIMATLKFEMSIAAMDEWNHLPCEL